MPGLQLASHLYSNQNILWAGIVCECLRRLGVQQMVISSGARVFPLIFAATHTQGLECISVLDERSAGFFALGLAQKSGLPVALVCTSGTAVAHYYAAIIEASAQNIPLLVLSADRPHTARACSTRQTLPHMHIFGSYVRWYHDLGPAQVCVSHMAYLRQVLWQACTIAKGPIPGPVHLNVPFEEPLGIDIDPDFQIWHQSIDWSTFFPDHYSTANPKLQLIDAHEPIIELITKTERGVLIVGTQPIQMDGDTETQSVYLLAQKLGWPILTDGFNGLRHMSANSSTVVAHYDTILAHQDLAQTLQPDVILHVGLLPLSKSLMRWLKASLAQVIYLQPYAQNLDELHRATITLPVSTASLAAVLPDKQPESITAYMQQWHRAEAQVRAYFSKVLEPMELLFEGKVSWLLSRYLPKGTPVFVASSSPLRDVETFWQTSSNQYQLYNRRGTNGIEGAVASALALAHKGRPAVLLTGDLSLLHDCGASFLIQHAIQGSLTIILINNNGGGIFESLAIAGIEPAFEQFIAVPQIMDFKQLAVAHGAHYLKPNNWTLFIQAIQELPQTGIRLIEVITDRKVSHQIRTQLMHDFSGYRG